MRHRNTVLAATLVCASLPASIALRAEEAQTLDAIIVSYLQGRGAEVQIAPSRQLARRYALDLTGVVPSRQDLETTASMTPAQMFDHFANKAAMPHTNGERPFIWINLLKDADHFLFSNSTQFSQVAHIEEMRDQMRRVYADGWSYQDFARWALESQMFLNRFPSAADRANAAFFLFLGRDSLAPEVPVGNMWNGYALTDPDIAASQAEVDPLYHAHDYDPARCTSGQVVCDATLWSQVGTTPAEAIEIIVTSPLFAEAMVDRYWQRFMGAPLPGVEFPDVRRVLVEGLVAADYDVNWLIHELAVSPAYTQEMMYR